MKKLKIIWQIVKWLGIAVLSLLLIGAIWFEAPWKVIVLLITLIVGSAVIPKPARKWFWAGVGAVVLVLAIWVFLPENNEGWRPYTFDDELVALEAKYAIPDEQNAATIYYQLLENYDSNELWADFFDDNDYELDTIISVEFWSGDDYPEAADWIKSHENLIGNLIKVSKIDKCHFPIPASTFDFGESMEIFSPMRNWARLLIRAGNFDIGQGRIDEGLQKYMAVLKMGNHQYQQPMLMNMLIGMAFESLAIERLSRLAVLGDANSDHLNFTEDTLTKNQRDWSSDFLRILEYEKLTYTKEFCGYFYEINSKGRIRLSRDPDAIIRNQVEKLSKEDFDEEIKTHYKRLAHLTYWRKKYMKAGAILSWFYMPSTPQAFIEMIDFHFEEYSKMASADFDWTKGAIKKFKIPVLPTPLGFSFHDWIMSSGKQYYSIHDFYLRMDSTRKASLLLVAIRRYKNQNGSWPENLDDIKNLTTEENLIDSVNKSSFVYKTTDEGFTLYSKGKNNIDDAGKRDRYDEEKTGADDWIVWPRNTKKVKLNENK